MRTAEQSVECDAHTAEYVVYSRSEPDRLVQSKANTIGEDSMAEGEESFEGAAGAEDAVAAAGGRTLVVPVAGGPSQPARRIATIAAPAAIATFRPKACTCED
jgi:hypothetical protein